MDYLRSVAQIAKAGTESEERSKLLASAADAKTRICIYGSANVIKALAEFEKGGPVLDSRDSMTSFLELCSEMRRQSMGKSEAPQADDLRLILFGSGN